MPVRYKKAFYKRAIGILQEEQDSQETIEYACRPQYGESIEIRGSDLGCLSVDHGSICSPLVVYPYELP